MSEGQINTIWNDEDKDELPNSLKNLLFKDLKKQIPFISSGGQKQLICRGYSQLSGDYIIEDHEEDDGKIFRRLIFSKNKILIQSEALIREIKDENKRTTKIIDVGYLACPHHIFMTVGVLLAPSIGTKRNGILSEVAVIGLGGGSLCTFITHCLGTVNITAVEIDEAMYRIAKNYFGLPQNEKIKVVIQDGIIFLKDAAHNARHFDAILFDIDSKDLSLGMSCPPHNFLDDEVMETVKQCIGADGVFVLNLVCGDEKQRQDIIKNLKRFFISICFYKLKYSCLNEIFFCCNDESFNHIRVWKKLLEKSVKKLNLNVKKHFSTSADLIDAEKFLKALNS